MANEKLPVCRYRVSTRPILFNKVYVLGASRSADGGPVVTFCQCPDVMDMLRSEQPHVVIKSDIGVSVPIDLNGKTVWCENCPYLRTPQSGGL